MNRREEKLLGLACFLGGMVAGFLIAPIKKGMYCVNNSGNTVKIVDELEKINGTFKGSRVSNIVF